MKKSLKYKMILILFFQMSISGFGQIDETIKINPDDSLILSKVDFLIYKVETLYDISSMQSSSITNMTLMFQLMNYEIQHLKQELDSINSIIGSVKVEGAENKKRRRNTSTIIL